MIHKSPAVVLIQQLVGGIGFVCMPASRTCQALHVVSCARPQGHLEVSQPGASGFFDAAM